MFVISLFLDNVVRVGRVSEDHPRRMQKVKFSIIGCVWRHLPCVWISNGIEFLCEDTSLNEDEIIINCQAQPKPQLN